MTTKLLAVVALCVLIAACETATNETKPAPSPATQSSSTPTAPAPAGTAAAPAASVWKAGDRVRIMLDGATVEATVVSIDEKLGKASVKVHGETKERTVNLSDIVKQ